MSEQVVRPRIRGFISLTAHPDGCAANVREQIAVARSMVGDAAGGDGLRHVLVVGSSTGYGLASTLCACFGYGADTVGVCLERPSEETRRLRPAGTTSPRRTASPPPRAARCTPSTATPSRTR